MCPQCKHTVGSRIILLQIFSNMPKNRFHNIHNDKLNPNQTHNVTMHSIFHPNIVREPDRGTNRQTKFRKYNRGFIGCSSDVRQTGVVARQTGTVGIVRSLGREAGMGWSRADDDRDRDPGQTMTEAGEGTGTRQSLRQTWTQELRQRLRKLGS